MNYLIIFFTVLCFSILSCILTQTDPLNPCTNYQHLPYAEDRLVNNKYTIGGDPAINDRVLSKGWYRVYNDADMPTVAPPLLSCGTRIPIWMKGNMPAVGSEVNRTACVYDDCSQAYDIKVKNCGSYKVYYLSPPDGTDEAYCFGMGDKVGKPTYEAKNLEVTVEAVKLPDPNKKGVLTRATCNFMSMSVENGKPLFYSVTWYFNDVAIDGKKPAVANHDNLNKINYITLEDAGFVIGSNISCSVRTKFSANGPPGKTVISPNYFFGIHVLTPQVNIQRGQQGQIQLKRSGPLGCIPFEDDTCAFEVVLTEDGHENCTGIKATASTSRFCGAKVLKSQEHIILTVEAEEGYNHLFSGSYSVFLQVASNGHDIWSNYQLPSIKVQTRFAPCLGDSKPFCTCGVAVQAGADVFVVNRCVDGDHKGRFVSCVDESLQVEKKNSKFFVAYMPLGTRVHIQFSRNFLTVQVFPGIRDKENTTGLCGTLTDNCPDDFLMPSGEVYKDSNSKKSCEQLRSYDYTFQPDKFSNSWSVKFESSFFNDTYHFQDLDRWPPENYLCTCDYTGSDNQYARPKVDCTSSKITTCDRGDLLKKGAECKIRTNRALQTFNIPKKQHREKRDMWRLMHIQERAVPESIPTTMNEAQKYCQDYAEQSEAFKLCTTIPNVDAFDSIQTCAMDILLSNSTDWIDTPREALKLRCLEELKMNETLQEAEEGKPSVAETIRNVACPGECGGVGVCVKGTCICSEGFGAPDCSINLSIPPYFDKILNDGICDKQDWECDSAVVDGEGFVEEGKPSCNIRPFFVDFNGTTTKGQDTVVPADVQTYLNLFCPLKQNIVKRSLISDSNVFVKGYDISLSNDGINFGLPQQLHIIDTLCQEPTTINGELRFILKIGFCFINGKCVGYQETNPSNICLECDSSFEQFTWSEKKGLSGCQKTYTNQPLWIIGAVLGIVAALLVIGIVIWRIKVRKMKRIQDSTIFVNPSTTNK